MSVSIFLITFFYSSSSNFTTSFSKSYNTFQFKWNSVDTGWNADCFFKSSPVNAILSCKLRLWFFWWWLYRANFSNEISNRDNFQLLLRSSFFRGALVVWSFKQDHFKMYNQGVWIYFDSIFAFVLLQQMFDNF